MSRGDAFTRFIGKSWQRRAGTRAANGEGHAIRAAASALSFRFNSAVDFDNQEAHLKINFGLLMTGASLCALALGGCSTSGGGFSSNAGGNPCVGHC